MKIGFSSNAFSNMSISNAIECLSKIGYDGIEIVLDSPHAFLPLESIEIYNIKNSLKTNNLLVTNLNSNTVNGYDLSKNNPFEPSLSNNNEKLRNWRIDYTKKSIDFAGLVDAPSVSITSGILNDHNLNGELNNFKKSLSILADYAEKHDIMLEIEYEPHLLIGNSDDVWRLISKDFNNIGLNLDTCHAAVLGENISGIIKKFDKKIFHTHISDCKNNIHYHLIPGLGDIDFNEMYNSLQQINYDGFLTAELYTYSKNPIEAASKAFIYLKNLMK
jgi:protein FrlC